METRDKTAEPSITYKVRALRYGIFDGRLKFQNYIIPDDHAAPRSARLVRLRHRGQGSVRVDLPPID